ncbi:hypothetical protein [Methanothrix sp.]|uniref:hypothetical protein n=1 Tax=Methanothrix sp. TaxID=90426 RepID=UPI0034E2461B
MDIRVFESVFPDGGDMNAISASPQTRMSIPQRNKAAIQPWDLGEELFPIIITNDINF